MAATEGAEAEESNKAVSRTGRKLPNRSKSELQERRPPPRSSTEEAIPSKGKATPRRKVQRSVTDGGDKLRKAVGSRRKKKGIRVAITVRKHTSDEEQQQAIHSKDNSHANSKDNEEQRFNTMYNMEVNCTGKFSRKTCWPDIDSFWGDSKKIDKDTMCDILCEYTESQYPERKGVDNVRPKRCYIKDEPLRGISFYKDYDWDPVKLHMNSRTTEDAVVISERWTRSVTLEKIPVDFETTNVSAILVEQGDKAVTSTLTKSKLQGHPLALAMMSSETQIITELRGLESVVGVLGNDETPSDVDPVTGDQIWRDVKTLRALLHEKPLPQKEGKGQYRVLEVVGLESYIKARVYYKAYVEGDVVSDHGVGLLLGERWWAHPLKDIMMGFDIENAAYIYEDIELRFFSEIGYKMENEYFDWENHGGKWIKVKKTRQTATSS